MDEHLQAVLDAPDDDAPRLAYADHVGGPRAEFIRFQIAHAKEPYLQWPGFDEHRDAWAEPVGPLVQRYRFRRGFIDEITVDADTWLARGEWMLQQAPIRNLNLTVAQPYIDKLADSPTLLRLRGLFLDHNSLIDRDVIRLVASPHLGNLRWLGLSYNQIGAAGAEALAASPNLSSLEKLSFDYNRVDFMPRTFDDWAVAAVSENVPPLFQEMLRKYGPKPWLRR